MSAVRLAMESVRTVCRRGRRNPDQSRLGKEHGWRPSISMRRPPRHPSSGSPALTDFGPGRSEIFENSADDDLEVHDQGPDRSRRHRGLERHLGAPALRLVRSQPRRPDHHRLQYLGRGLGPHLHLHAASPTGPPTRLVVVRDGKNLKGRVLGIVLESVGKGRLKKAFDGAVNAIEARAAKKIRRPGARSVQSFAAAKSPANRTSSADTATGIRTPVSGLRIRPRGCGSLRLFGVFASRTPNPA